MSKTDRFRWSVRTSQTKALWRRGVRKNVTTIRTKYFDTKALADKYAVEMRGQGFSVSIRRPAQDPSTPQQNHPEAQRTG